MITDRPKFKFKIGESEFEVCEPTVEDLKRTELELNKPYAMHIRETGDMPEGAQIDALLVHTLAAVKKPKLTAAEVRAWPAKKWYALQMALARTIDVNSADDVTFFHESNRTGNDSVDARVQDVTFRGGEAIPQGFSVSVTGSTAPTARVQTSAQEGARIRPRSVRKRAGGQSSQAQS